MNVKFPVTETAYGSLPPFVEGEVSFYLTLKVDQVLWKKKAPGDVTLLVRWWGENTIPVFKPRDVKKNSKNPTKQYFSYKIKTKIDLFETYLEDSEHLELFIVECNTNKLVGSGKIKNLKRIIYENPYQIYVPILNPAGRIADVHVCFQLHDSDSLDNQLIHLGCTTFASKSLQPIFSFCPFNDKQRLKIGSGSEKCVKNLKYWPHNSNVNNTVNSTAIVSQTAKHVSSNDILLKVLDQSVKLRNAMVKSILEDDDLFMSRSMTGNSTESRNTRHTVASPGGTFGVGIEPDKRVMDYLLGDVLNRNSNRHQGISQNMSPIPDAIELMEKSINVDSSSDIENIQAVQEEVMPYDTTSSSEQHENVVHPVSEKDIKLCSKEKLFSGETSVNSLHIEPCNNRIRWLRVDVCQLVLQLDNVLKILGTSFLPKASFFAEFELPRDLVCPCKSKQQKPWNSQTHRFCSRKQLNNVVHFDKSISCRIQAGNSDTFQKIKSSKLTFSVYLRHVKRKSPVLIGTTDLSLCNILKPDAPCKYEIPVHSKIQYCDSSLIVGILNVVIEAMSSKEVLKTEEIHNGFSTDQQLRNHPQILQQHTEVSKENALQLSEVTSQNCFDSQVTLEKTLPVQQQLIMDSSSKITGEKRNTETQKKSYMNEVPLRMLLCIHEGCGFKCNSTYLVNRLLWADKMSQSQMCHGTETPKYNFQETIPVHLDDTFLQRCYNNTLITEVWCDGKLLGLAHLPLQKFYNAFSDLSGREKVLNEKFPVIGLDGWVDIVNPVSGLKAGQILAFLAAGTETQIKAFDSTNFVEVCETKDCKTSDFQESCAKRNAKSDLETEPKGQLEKVFNNSHNSSPKGILKKVPNIRRITDGANTGYSNIIDENYVYEKDIVSEVTSACESTESTKIHIMKKSSKQTSEEEKTPFTTKGKSYDRSSAQKYHQSQSSVKLKPSRPSKENIDSFVVPEVVSPISSDIEMSLSQTSGIANNGKRKSEYAHDYASSSDTNYLTSAEDEKQKYSSNDLPSTGTSSAQLAGAFSTLKMETSHTAETKNHHSSFHAHVEILSALHLPLVKRNRKRVQPSCYVTFDTCVPRAQGGKQLATPVAWYTTSPNWDWSCDTWLSAELLKDKNKMLVFKIWLKAESTERDKHNLLGCVSVDLTVLLFGMPWISGWFNIMDFTGNNKGQIKINITPVESLTRFSIQQLSEENQKLPFLQEAASFFDISDISNVPSRFVQKGSATLNKNKREMDCTQSLEYSVETTNKKTLGDVATSSSDDLADISSCLSSALKSKLLELDEITQRLKSRLSCVTQGDDFSNDPSIGLEDIIREEHKSWDSCEPSSVINSALTEQSHEKLTTFFAQEEDMSPSAYNEAHASDSIAEGDMENKSRSPKHIQRDQFNADYKKTVDKMAALSFEKSKDADNCVNDFDSLTNYFRDIANKDIELENVFNPLLFQQLLSLSDPQPISHKGREKSEPKYCEVADNILSSNKNEEEGPILKVGSELNDESRSETRISCESVSEMAETQQCDHKLQAHASNLNVGFIPTGKKATIGNYSLDTYCRIEGREKKGSENLLGIDNCGSVPSENLTFLKSSQSNTESTQHYTPKIDSLFSGNLASQREGLFTAENSSNSSEVLRLAPEGGNPTENSTHNIQNISANKTA